MIINKNKLKLIPIFNKSLKEIYTNKKYDMIHLYSLLKEDTDVNTDELDNLDLSVSVPQNEENKKYFYLKHEDQPEYIHIFTGSLDDNKNIINANYLYSYNQELSKFLDDNLNNLINQDVYKLKAKVQNEKIKKLLATSFISLINENLKNGLLNDKNNLKQIIDDLIKDSDNEFKNFKNFIIENSSNDDINFSTSRTEFDESYESYETNRQTPSNKRLNQKVNVELNVKDTIKDAGDIKLDIDFFIDNNNKKNKIYLIEEQIKEYFENHLLGFSYIDDNIKIIDDNQNPIIIKIKKIASTYTDNFDELLFEILKVKEEDLLKYFRKTPTNINDAQSILNDTNNAFSFTKKYLGKGGSQGKVKGKGELSVHLMLNTTNVCTLKEPDAIIKTNSGDIKCSVKYFLNKSSSTQTGERMQQNIKTAYDKFLNSLNINSLDFSNLLNVLFNILKTNDNINTINVDKFKKIFSIDYTIIENNSGLNINKQNVIDNYKNLKKEIASEHDAEYVICFHQETDPNFKFIDCSKIEDVANNLQISKINSNRFEFRTNNLLCVTNNFNKCTYDLDYFSRKNEYGRIETILVYILLALDNNQDFINKINKKLNEIDEQSNNKQTYLDVNTVTAQQQNSGYKRKGMTLKEVFKNLY